ncbi:BirA family transcriptional regulator, biotin operon repressor / biotin-[acetyl-CoA-carboxylase] ligase [Desulforhopalus singaporensis]|uniref:biotin--[biotin carboxyl-carrier protein] ligase n=2 Tax=Desulforhopalus singaporensis TaxID=91360 RepID=A0A1H0NDU8_9BACT|nr:BirA family transcriptional regulator, biotin operon repressor / biotin-[acetyl-CoA-carboxylase] ligase [Desulforhopalus singaporensis]
MFLQRLTPEAVGQKLAVFAGSGFGGYSRSRLDIGKVVGYGLQVGSVIRCHPTLPRAMDHARDLIVRESAAGRSFASGTVIIAETMTKSKGRFTRSWHAPPGGLWGCMVHANTLLPQSRHFIPMAVGVACCEAVGELGCEPAAIRWVNDVLIEGRKVAGFLVEGYTEPGFKEEFNLVGFGINVNNSSFPPDLSGTAGSVSDYLGREVDLTDFGVSFLARLAWNIGLLYHEEERELAGKPFSGRGGIHALLARWLELSDTIGQDVIYGFDVVTNPQYPARVVGVDDSGGLILELEDGHRKTEYSGEVRYR